MRKRIGLTVVTGFVMMATSGSFMGLFGGQRKGWELDELKKKDVKTIALVSACGPLRVLGPLFGKDYPQQENLDYFEKQLVEKFAKAGLSVIDLEKTRAHLKTEWLPTLAETINPSIVPMIRKMGEQLSEQQIRMFLGGAGGGQSDIVEPLTASANTTCLMDYSQTPQGLDKELAPSKNFLKALAQVARKFEADAVVVARLNPYVGEVKKKRNQQKFYRARDDAGSGESVGVYIDILIYNAGGEPVFKDSLLALSKPMVDGKGIILRQYDVGQAAIAVQQATDIGLDVAMTHFDGKEF